MRAWIGLALLSASWLLGLAYYHGPEWWAASRLERAEAARKAALEAGEVLPAEAEIRLPFWTQACRESAIAWAVTVMLGTLLLAERHAPAPSRPEAAVALALLIPALVLMPWPYRAAPLLMALGAALGFAPRARWLFSACSACLLAGGVLLAQALAMLFYAAGTARSHDLPAPLTGALGWAFRALAIQTGIHESTVAAYSMRKTHLFGATWGLLLDPVTWCFLVGGMVLLAWRAWNSRPDGARGATTAQSWPMRCWRTWGRPALALLLLVALWLPLRAALLAALCLDDVLRTDYDAPLTAVEWLWNPWIHLALLTVPVLLAWRFCGNRAPSTDPDGTPPAPATIPAERRVLAAALAMGAVGLFAFGYFWSPIGARKQGRVVVEEFHPPGDEGWERTDKPFDTEAYWKNAAYTYSCIYQYCDHHYEMSRLTAPIDAAALDACDVLVLKTPTRAYSSGEIDAIQDFVDRGGGLLLLGEHTDVFHTGEHLNAVARRFGFRFRYDCLFGIDSVFEQPYDRPLVPHPIAQYLAAPQFTPRYTPSLDYAISCSIAPQSSLGRAAMLGTGLKNKEADYHAENFYPQTDDVAEMRYGAFVQLLAMRSGAGRVAAFSDSTQFSNFSIMDPGKTELLVGMVEWLNHGNRGPSPRPWLWTVGTLLLIGAAWAARGWHWAWLVLTAAGLLGWTSATLAARELHRTAMPWPAVKAAPPPSVVIDRTLCDSKLPVNGFIPGKDGEFGIFERWILRLGYFPSRRAWPATSPSHPSGVFQGDLLVFFYPNRPAPPGFQRKLEEYVSAGGKVLVIDSPDNGESTASEILVPFGLALDASQAQDGDLNTRGRDWPSIPISGAAIVRGGDAFAWVHGKPVAARAPLGHGSVTVVGFGSRFSDSNMGVTGDLPPDKPLRAVYEVQFALLRFIMEDSVPGGTK